MKLTKIGVGGLTSNVGKTTLVCDLLGPLGGWEAIKATRGHFRSCGKDAHACCVSHLLSDEPKVFSGRAETFAKGKDTGRFWDAGASNVHWVIATSEQVERGVRLAMSRVVGPGVIVEGNSPVESVGFDLFVMVARADSLKIKPTARRALKRTSALYLSSDGDDAAAPTLEEIEEWRKHAGLLEFVLPIYTRETLPDLINLARSIHERRSALAVAPEGAQRSLSELT